MRRLTFYESYIYLETRDAGRCPNFPPQFSKLEWLRGAVKKGVDQLDRGEGIEFDTMDDLCGYIDRIGEEVSAEIATERKRA